MLGDLRRHGLNRGLLEGSRPWILLGAVAWAIKGIQWAMRREESVVHRGVVTPGDKLLITSEVPAPAKGGRRRRARHHGGREGPAA